MSQETSGPLPPGPRARIALDMLRGDEAAVAGLPPTACPYDVGELPLSQAAWIAGYGRARRRIDPDGTPSAISEACDPD